MLSEQQEAILREAVDKNYVLFKDALDYYLYEESASRSLKNLVEKGYLYFEYAPDRCREIKVWFPTEKCLIEFE